MNKDDSEIPMLGQRSDPLPEILASGESKAVLEPLTIDKKIDAMFDHVLTMSTDMKKIKNDVHMLQMDHGEVRDRLLENTNAFITLSDRVALLEGNRSDLPQTTRALRNEDLSGHVDFVTRLSSLENDVRSGLRNVNETLRQGSAASIQGSRKVPGAAITNADAFRSIFQPAVQDEPEHNVKETFIKTFSELPREQEKIFDYRPPFDDIKLHDLILRNVLQFVKKAQKYTAKYKRQLPIPQLVSNEVRTQLVSRFSRSGLTHEKWNQLSDIQAIALIQRFVQPMNWIGFWKYMDQNVYFNWPSSEKEVTEKQFPKFHIALLEYSEAFNFVYKFLAEDNEGNVPQVNKKDGGILKLFFSKIPTNFSTNLFARFSKKVFDNWDSFFQEFHEHVQALDEQYRGYADNFQPMFSANLSAGTMVRPTVEAHTTSSKPREASREGSRDNSQDRHYTSPRAADARNAIPVYGKADGRSNFNPVGNYRNRANLNALGRDSDSELEDLLESAAVLRDSDLDDSPVVLPDQDSDSDDNVLHEPAATAASEIAAIDSKAKSSVRFDYSKTPCTSTILEGVCKKSGCTRSHSPALLRAGWLSIKTKLQNSKYAPSDQGANRKSLHAFHAIVNAEIDKIAKNPERSMKALGKVVIKGNNIPITALFDSGANSGNYISQYFLEQNAEVLSQIVKDCHTKVTLGDSETLVPIDKSIVLTLQFMDSSGALHKVRDKFFVIPHRTHDVIVGLPAMTHELFHFFMELFQQYRDSHPRVYDEDVDLLPLEQSEDKIVDVKIGDILSPPWVNEVLTEAPEELNTYIPCSFSYQLSLMEKELDELYQSFVDLLPTHVDSQFAANTKIIEYLKTRGWKAFIPQDWTGINGIAPYKIRFDPNMPKTLKARVYPINERIMTVAKKEFQRLLLYFYVKSVSPISSPLVIAPKDTAPHVRFCGGYTEVNKYIIPNQETIPQVRYYLTMVQKFKIFHDVDMRNAFHQVKLDEETSEILSVSTPWGQYRPLFMPEGIKTATGTLQSIVNDVFTNCMEWVIAIFDNILCLCTDYDDAYDKCVHLCELCIERNLYLKMEKTWLGVSEVKFFGYRVNKDGFTLTEDRKEEVSKIPFPTTTKQVQRFLGMSLYFSSCIPNYQVAAAPLYDLTRKDFNWDESHWTKNYRELFEDFKKLLYECWTIHYPDYELNWILRTDASEIGVGAILLQERPAEDPKDPPVLEPIAVVSQKLSPQAQRWSVIEREAYAIFHAVQKFSYFLLGKFFLLETDHNNLLWMDQSKVPKIIRWKIYLQQYSFLVRHISGKLNVAADALSRNLLALSGISHSDMISEAHTFMGVHRGIHRTYDKVNELFPGNDISLEEVRSHVADCNTCQKTRLASDASNPGPVYRHLHVDHPHAAIGVDHLTIASDNLGNVALIVIVNFFTKYVWLVPVADYTAVTLARALFQYYCIFGIYSELHSDPGSAMTSEALDLLHKWFGITHVFSLVDRHESCGVEGTNKQVLRHLQAIVQDRRVKEIWSAPEVLSLIMYHLNSEVHSETGYKPMELQFGSVASVYQALPESASANILSNDYLRLLNRYLVDVTAASKEYQDNLIKSRETSVPVKVYQPGDFILTENVNKDSKLSAKYLGPYVVIDQVKNDITCRHCAIGQVFTFNVERVKPFHGSPEQAYETALRDHDQYVINRILSYRGEPTKRSTMEFLVQFGDGSLLWKPYTKDLFDSLPYEEFCNSKPQLLCLLKTAIEGDKLISEINKSPIDEVAPGDMVYINLRGWDEVWYASLDLPDPFEVEYLLEGKYGAWANKKHTKIVLHVPVLKQRYEETHYRVFAYGSIKDLSTINYRIIDAEAIKRYPQLKAISK
jgi:hypothetical protein